MNIAMTGATGFLGKRLIARLLADGHELHLAGRRAPSDLPAGVRFSLWPAPSAEFPVDAIAAADAIIHLVGEPVAQRWTADVKQRIRSSRIDGTLQLAEALAGMARKPRTLVCASASGYYGDRGNEVLSEDSAPGTGFLPEVCVEWEKAADFGAALGMRVVKVRIGIVLGDGGGALSQMLTPFRAGVGGKLGSGRQWMSWIHVEDIVGLFRFALNNESLSGPVNGTAPNPVNNAEFTRLLARAVHRPAILTIPEFALRLLYGEMAEITLVSQRVLPKAAEASGYQFRFTDLGAALADLRL
jgi:uncharacterized protein (TIGR01777 family)